MTFLSLLGRLSLDRGNDFFAFGVLAFLMFFLVDHISFFASDPPPLSESIFSFLWKVKIPKKAKFFVS